MLKSKHLFAKIGVDKAENEPSKVYRYIYYIHYIPHPPPVIRSALKTGKTRIAFAYVVAFPPRG